MIQRNFPTSSANPNKNPDTASIDRNPSAPRKYTESTGLFLQRFSSGEEIIRTTHGNDVCPGAWGKHTFGFPEEETDPSGDGTAGIWAKAGVSLE